MVTVLWLWKSREIIKSMKQHEVVAYHKKRNIIIEAEEAFNGFGIQEELEGTTKHHKLTSIDACCFYVK